MYVFPDEQPTIYDQHTRIAIVEDNATARANLRSHLLTQSELEISSFSNGKELRNALRTRIFDVIFMDFHLGQNKNGVEWLQSLSQSEILLPSTSIIFITSDRLPQTIGQILDIYPDMILLKPYTIKSIISSFKLCLQIRKQLYPALEYLDKKDPGRALEFIQTKLDSPLNKRYRTSFIKWKGRLLLQIGEYNQAMSLYEGILKRSSNILWAHWGLIKSQFLAGKWHDCESGLNSLLSAKLSKDKAHEWLACMAISEQNYALAEQELDKILDNDLSIQATKLKILAFQMQGKNELAIALLEKKRQNNLTVKERFDEFTIELARYYLSQAEKQHIDDRINDLLSAKKLIGNASHFMLDGQSEQQRTYMLARASLLEGDKSKATRLVEQNPHNTQPLTRIATMTDAVKVWFGLGHVDKAKEILAECDAKLMGHSDQIDMILASSTIAITEQDLGLTKDKAIRLNEKGMKHYSDGNNYKAIDYFFRAFSLYPGVPAFALNLLQSMVELGMSEYKHLNAQVLVSDLKSISLSDVNSLKLDRIEQKLA